MNKKWFIPLIILCLLGLVYIMGSLTGTLLTATMAASSNEPNITAKSRIWISNLSKPQRFSFICYNMETNPSGGWEGGKWVMRLCGLPGDKIQIIDGTLFVNGRNADTGLNLMKPYVIPTGEMTKLGDRYVSEHREDVYPMENDSMGITLPTAVFKSKSLHGRLVIDSSTAGIQKIYDHPWSRDNFGPIIVPDGKFFVLGDNRHGACDSRYTGFIDQGKYVGTLLFR